jgi:hypothetical protein
VGRYIHATAIAESDINKRVLGMQLTFASMVMGVAANVVPLKLSRVVMTSINLACILLANNAIVIT